MMYLLFFMLGILAYNYVFPVFEALFGYIAFKFIKFRSFDEMHLREMEAVMQSAFGKKENRIGFRMDDVEDDFYDEEDEEYEEDEE